MNASVRVLVADDQVAFRRAAQAVLGTTVGFELVGEAASGEEAVALIPALRPDLILMDVKMPGIGGIEAARRIASLQPETTILLVSTYRAGDLPNDASDCGAFGYLDKENFGSDSLRCLWLAAHPSRSAR